MDGDLIMELRIANAPVSWGVDYADAPGNPPWSDVLDGIAAAGYRWIELGPVGYLPEDREALGEALAARELQVAGTFLFDYLHDPARRERVLDAARRTCALIARAGGDHLVVLDHLSDARTAVAGRSAQAPRLQEGAERDMLDAIRRVAEIAAEHGLRPVFHPHAGTYVEHRDEIDGVMNAVGADELGLCIDTGHSAYAGVDPIALYRDYRERCDYFHFKDIDPVVHARVLAEGLDFDTAVGLGVFCPLGAGVVDFPALREALDETGFRGIATIEQDRDPAVPADPIEDARRSLRYLGDVGLASPQ
ncbi:MAG TPA: TIM barrel protein [Solirubrobacteraceae bacterium]